MPTEQLVFSNSSLTVDHPDYQTTVQELAQELRALPEVASVVTYYDSGDSDRVSADGHVLLATAPSVQTAVASLMEQVSENGAYIGPFETVVNPEGDRLFIQEGEL